MCPASLRANVDYGFATSRTTYCAIGVKVWIYLGDVMPGQRVEGMPGDAGGKHAQEGRGLRSERGDGGSRQPRGGRGGRGGRGRRSDNAPSQE